jgi:hypothetical protein
MGEGSLLRVVGDSQRLIDNAGGDTETARKVPFVKALGMFKSKATVIGNTIQERTTLETNEADLDSDELPLPEGNVAAELPSADAFAGLAIKDPGHLVRFGENAAKQASPDQFGQYEQGLKQLKSTSGVDLHVDLLGQIEDLSVGFLDRGRVEFRARLKDAQGFKQSLEKAQQFLQGVLNGIGEGDDLTLAIEGGGDETTYLVKQGGVEVARFAVAGDALVGSIGPRGDLPSPTQGEPIHGAPGSLVGQLSLDRIGELPGVDPQSIDPLAREILASLGTVTQGYGETTESVTETTTLELGHE